MRHKTTDFRRGLAACDKNLVTHSQPAALAALATEPHRTFNGTFNEIQEQLQ